MPKKPPSSKDIERAAAVLTYLYETKFLDQRRMLWLNFVRGFVQGVGGFLGATLGVGLMLWLASLLLDIPILGSIIESLRSLAT